MSMIPLFFAAAVSLATPIAGGPDCAPWRLHLAVEGSALIVRNAGPACRMPGLPALGFTDAQGKGLLVSRQTPRFMHPGPVVPPVLIPAGGVVRTTLGWSPGGACVSPAMVNLAVGDGPPLTAPFSGRICGTTFTQGWFRP